MTAPAEPPLLASAAELAGLLGVPADSPKLLAALRDASRRFRGAVRHPVHKITADEAWLDGDGSTELLLPAIPVLARPLVEVDGQALEASGFEWSRTGILRRHGGWPDRLNAIRVVYDHGYDPIPEDIAEAVLDQACVMYDPRRRGVQSVQAGGTSVTYGATSSVGVTAQWTTAVEAYRLGRDRA